MSDFTPVIPVVLQIRKIIFEKFNDVDIKFTNDEIFEILKKMTTLIRLGLLMTLNLYSMKFVILVLQETLHRTLLQSG
jgi:hypothetical protein